MYCLHKLGRFMGLAGSYFEKGTMQTQHLLSCLPPPRARRSSGTWRLIRLKKNAHIRVNNESGLVHTVKVTAANVHVATVTSDLLTGEEEMIYGDIGYLGADKRPEALKKNKAGKTVHYKLNRRPSVSKNRSACSMTQIKRREHEKSYVRA